MFSEKFSFRITFSRFVVRTRESANQKLICCVWKRTSEQASKQASKLVCHKAQHSKRYFVITQLLCLLVSYYSRCRLFTQIKKNCEQ